MLVGVAVSCPEVTPVPETGTVTVLRVLRRPLLLVWVNAIETFPLLLPAEGGANVRVPVTLCPLVSVKG